MLQVSDLKGGVHIVHIVHTLRPCLFLSPKISFLLWIMWTT